MIFTSDNGFFHGEHRVPNGKLLVYEPSSRVPLLIRGPGIRGGRTTREMAVNTDLAATVVDVTGAKPTRSIDGRSLIPFAERTSRPNPRARCSTRSSAREPAATSSRTAPRRPADAGAARAAGALLPRGAHQPLAVGGVLRRSRELYDLARDPQQLRSRHADRRYRRTRAALRKELARLAKCKGKSCRRQAAPHPRPVSRR